MCSVVRSAIVDGLFTIRDDDVIDLRLCKIRWQSLANVFIDAILFCISIIMCISGCD